jgi:hypothetical protein
MLHSLDLPEQKSRFVAYIKRIVYCFVKLEAFTEEKPVKRTAAVIKTAREIMQMLPTLQYVSYRNATN